jgi:hypothetical protein
LFVNFYFVRSMDSAVKEHWAPANKALILLAPFDEFGILRRNFSNLVFFIDILRVKSRTDGRKLR